MHAAYVVTLCGKPGTGTSSVVREMKSNHGFASRSTGDIFREQAAAMFPELSQEEGLKAYRKHAEESNGEVDRTLDLLTLKWMEQQAEQKILSVVDSRLAWNFCKESAVHSLNVLLICDEHECAKRTALREGITVEEAFRNSRVRTADDLARYKRFYGIDPSGFWDNENFDLIINTAKFGVKSIARMIALIRVGAT